MRSMAYELKPLTDQFLEVLHAYERRSPAEEAEVIQELRTHVQQNANCFDRVHEEHAKHISASVLLVTRNATQGLFLLNAKLGRWAQPGGHADGDPDIHRVAMRELKEETGVEITEFLDEVPIDIARYDCSPMAFGYKKSMFDVCFMAALPKGQVPQIVEKNKCYAMRWVNPREALKLNKRMHHEACKRLIEKWEAYLATIRRGQ